MIQVPLNITLFYKNMFSNIIQSDAGKQKYNFYMQFAPACQKQHKRERGKQATWYVLL